MTTVPTYVLKVELVSDLTEISEMIRKTKLAKHPQQQFTPPPSPTLQEKYDWLCKQLEITDPDFWEQDASIKLKNTWPEVCGDECRSLYFQFSSEEYPKTIDQAVVLAMRSDIK